VNNPSTSVAGEPVNVTVEAISQFNTIASNYTGTVTFFSFDPQAVLPPDYTFTAADHGKHTFKLTFKTAGFDFFFVNDLAQGAGGFGQIIVSPGPVAKFLIGSDSPATQGFPFTFNIVATDAFGNTVTNYTGTVHFTSSDPNAKLPADYTFVASDQGRHSFSVDFATLGMQTITVEDELHHSIFGTVLVDVVASPPLP